MKTVTTFLLALLLGLTSTWAATESPKELIEDTAQRLIDELNQNRAALEQDRSQLYGMVEEIILPHMDFQIIARWVLGKYWRRATPEQRQRFTEEFRELLVTTYASAILEYSGEKYEFLPMPDVGNADEATVRAEFYPNNKPPIPVSYSLHRRKGDWKVYDVTVDGISLVTNYRSSFSTQIRDQGLDALIEDIAKRNEGEQ